MEEKKLQYSREREREKKGGRVIKSFIKDRNIGNFLPLSITYLSNFS